MQVRNYRRLLLAIAAVLFTAAPSARAQTPLPANADSPAQLLVRTSGEPGIYSWPRQLTLMGNLIYYTAGDRNTALWRSDGTPQGTFDLGGIYINKLFPAATRVFYGWSYRDNSDPLYPSAYSGLGVSDGTRQGTTDLFDYKPLNALTIGDTLYFYGSRYDTFGGPDYGITIEERYGFLKSDGTRQGTILLKEMYVSGLLSFGGTVYFSGEDFKGNSGLWKSNGTPQGTVLVKAMGRDALGASATLGGRFYFVGDSPGGGQELWASDGTSNGTVLVKDIRPGALGSSPQELVALGGKLWFSADDGVNGREPWVSDGTPQGTRLVSDLAFGSNDSSPYGIKAFGAGVAFTSTGNFSGTVNIWRSDGTPQGTLLLATGQNTTSTPYDVGLTTVGGALYFQTQSQTQAGPQSTLWKSDGTPQGTTPLLTFDSRVKFVTRLFSLGGALAFGVAGAGATALWRSDGTPQGTTMVKRFSGIDPDAAIVRGGTLFFSADDGARGFELWMSDGSPQGTQILKDLKGDDVRSYPSAPVALGSTAFFSFYQDATGYELWASNGSPQGTAVLKDIRPGAESSRPLGLKQEGGKLYFSADDGIHGREPWVSDGTAAGTQLLKDLTPGPDDSSPESFGAVGNRLYFVATTVTSDGPRASLWASDGSEAGTSLLKAAGDGESFLKLATASDKLFFTIGTSNASGGNQSELWASDGTPAGTVSLGQHVLGKAVTGQGGRAFLTLADRTAGTALWASDGTPAGTTLLKTIEPAKPDSVIDATPSVDSTLLGGTLYFKFKANTGVTGEELWKSDGTPQGTIIVKGFKSLRLSDSSVSSGKLLFLADDGAHGDEQWTSDGSADGTVRVKDINPGLDHSFSSLLSKDTVNPTPFGDTRVFVAEDNAHGYELWVSDGSADGTRLVQDLNPGQASGMATLYPSCGRRCPPYWRYNDLWPAGGRLYFVGKDSQGRAFWSIFGGVDGQVGIAKGGVRPGGTTNLPIRYGNLGLGTATMTLTVTLRGGLIYLGDSSGITPTLVTSDTISWQLSKVSIGAHGVSLLLQAPLGATLGERLPVTLSLDAPGDADLSNNTISSTVLVARQTSLALVGR